MILEPNLNIISKDLEKEKKTLQVFVSLTFEVFLRAIKIVLIQTTLLFLQIVLDLALPPSPFPLT